MTLWSQLIEIARRTVREPRDATADLCRLNLPRDVLMIGFLAVMVCSVIVTEPMLAFAASVFESEPMPPLARAIGTTISSLIFVWVLWKMGEMMGGSGQFDHVFATFVVLEAIFVIGIAGFSVLMVLVPTIAAMAGLGFGIYWLWMFSNALAEVHRFPSAWKALGIVVVAWIIMNYLGVLLMGLITGLVGGPSNV